MKIIKEIVENIQEELDGAEEYAEMAVKTKEDDRVLSDTFYTIANQELAHVDMLHSQVVRIIKAQTKEPPAAMMAVWNWEHERMIERVAGIKVLLDMYKR